MTARSLSIASAVLVAFVAAPLAAAERHAGLAARLAMPGYVGPGDRPVVELTLRNDSPEDVFVLSWQTPFASLTHQLFEVRRDGREVEYLGPHVKFAAPRAEDYIRIAAGAARTATVDLAQLYDFSRTGEYSVQYRVNVQDAIKLDGPLPEPGFIASNRVFAAVERPNLGGFRPRVEELRNLTGEASTSFVSCSTTRQSTLHTARTNATSYANNSYSYLASGKTGSRYTWWFGTYNSTRYSTVRTHFNNIAWAAQNADITFNCGCTSNAYAYVYPTQPYKIWLCSAFWSAPATGTDSKAGTIVHELSHFNVLGGTDDWAYGQSAAHNLAVSNPSRAVDNADNHEYFAENTPYRN